MKKLHMATSMTPEQQQKAIAILESLSRITSAKRPTCDDPVADLLLTLAGDATEILNELNTERHRRISPATV